MQLPDLATSVKRLCGSKFASEISMGDSGSTVTVRLGRLNDLYYTFDSPRVTVYGRLRHGEWRATVGADHASYYTMTPELSELVVIGKRIADIINKGIEP
jgi:hypothetical protein